MQVEIRERGTFRLVGTYPVDSAGGAEPPAPQKCGDVAWAQAVTAGHVDPNSRDNYEILVQLVTLGYGADTDLWPMTLLEGAQGSTTVADAAVRQLGRLDASNPQYLIVLFLLAQAIELALKAFLRLNGYTEEQLKDLDHNLSRLLHQACALTFPRPQPADTRLLELLNDTYLKGRKLQFHRASDIRLPFLRPIRELAAEYICAFPLVRASPSSTIDEAADYGEPSLADFRAGARGTDLRSPRLAPADDEPKP